MRKFIIPLLSLLFLTISCTSQEEKAQEAISEYIKENVVGVDSYTPISTTVDSAFVDYATDQQSLELFIDLGQILTKAQEYLNDMEEAERSMSIWKPSGYLSSATFDYEYNKAKNEYESSKESLEKVMTKAYAKFDELKQRQNELNIGEFQGWLVRNKFKVMNTDTNKEEICDLIFLMTPDYKVIDSFTEETFESAIKLMNAIANADNLDDLQDLELEVL